MRDRLPPGLKPCRRTSIVRTGTVPAGLLANHSTKKGVWARVVVLEGTLPFRFLEPEEEPVLLTPERPGIVEPARRHRVEPGPDVRFYVEFHRAGPPLTSRGSTPC